jgi:cytochrome c oxidase cbb3-type subunit 3
VKRLTLTKLLILVIGVLCVLSSCRREKREFTPSPPVASLTTIPESDLFPGGSPAPALSIKNPLEGRAYDLSEGKRLYQWYNCNGCHAAGGGAIGPPLMDDKWIYGGQPEQVFASIVEGRPNGMPTWRGKIPDSEVWQLAAYVRSMTGLASKDAAPGRDDHMQAGKPENSRKRLEPKNTGIPKSGEMP